MLIIFINIHLKVTFADLLQDTFFCCNDFFCFMTKTDKLLIDKTRDDNIHK